MRLRTTGMEFASEMVINAAKAKLRVAEGPDYLLSARWRVEAPIIP